MDSICFDFGDYFAIAGYTKVKSDSLYDESKGYGLDKVAESGRSLKGDKELNRDYLLMGDNAFRVKLDNGAYLVRVNCGDYDDEGDVTTSVDVNGVDFSAWIMDGTVAETVQEVEVSNGVMVFSVANGKHPCLNAVEISKKQDIQMPDVSVKVEVAPDGRSKAILTWDRAEGVMGYFVRRKNLTNSEVDIREYAIKEEYVDETVVLANSYEYKIFGLYGFKFRTASMKTVNVKIVDGGEVPERVQEISMYVTADTVELEWQPVERALCYNIYQKAPYGIYKKIGTSINPEYVDKNVTVNCNFMYAVEAVTTSGVTDRKHIMVSKTPAKKFKRKMETLDRALVAMKVNNGVFLSWRLNAWEYEAGVDFIIERNGKRITRRPIQDSTNYLDKEGQSGDVYTVKAVLDGKAEKTGYSRTVIDTPYIPIPIDKPDPITLPDGTTHEYHANDAAVGDLDGDGEYEIVLRWDANPKDNSHKGYTGNVLLDAYKLNGKKLWRIDLGVNIRGGQHYTQMMVYDLNNDGKAELVVKTADGTIDGQGHVIGDAAADYRNSDGYILRGPEYLTLFEGETGAVLDNTDYDPPRGNVREWGDSWGNRVDRFLACIAYLDGVNPSVVMCRGYYDHGCPTVLVAYDVIDNKLVKKWKFMANRNQNIEYTNQGNHNLGVADIDGDGYDEIVYGAMAVDHDGTGIYSTGLEHGDCMNLGKFLPDADNMQFFQIHEHESAEYGFEVRDPATGEISWGKYTGRDTTRGLCAKIDPRYKGNQVWVMDDCLYTFDGKVITEKAPESINFGIWWDGDLLRELLDAEMEENERSGHPKIYKWDYENEKLETILDPVGTLSNNWKKCTPCLQASIIGDWREDVIWRNEDDTELRLYTTTKVTNHKFYTLMHDHVYRLSVAWQNTAYNQCPQTGFYIGTDMRGMPPVPENEYVRGEIKPEFTEDI